MKRSVQYSIISLLICQLLSSCGQSGRLYLPNQPAPNQLHSTGHP